MSNNIPENFRYSKEHEWVIRDEKNDNVVIIGITDHAQEALGDIVHVELCSQGTHIAVNDELGVVESAKSASELYAPVSGKVVGLNCALDQHPEKVNESPYDEGWVAKIRMEDPDELDSLLSADGYQKFLDEEA
jgi:glycine cleavage system H protein